MVVYLIAYVASYLFAIEGHYYLSGFVLMASALWLYYEDYKRSKNLIHLRGIFALFWIGGQGISCLKLSQLQGDWDVVTWLCFFLAFLGFWLSFEFLSKKQGDPNHQDSVWNGKQGESSLVFIVILVLTAVCSMAFLLEAMVLGYVPLFVRGVPHAYSEFHISGVHYFTVSCVLVPALAVIYFFVEKGRCEKKGIVVLLCSGIALLIPILCVSRFQLIFAMALLMFTYVALQKRLKLRYLILAVALLILLYVGLTVARGHDVSYLNGIFEMKSSNTPIFITQPYMYIANNYDNFNELVGQLPAHTWGLRMLFPLWALTGLKFLIPFLVSFPIYTTKPELTTVTLFYDAYYDFGVVGVFFVSCFLGVVAYYLVRGIKNMRNPIGYLFYVQVAVYFMLSFFTTWFSNPTTWFYLVITGIAYCYCEWAKVGGKKKNGKR